MKTLAYPGSIRFRALMLSLVLHAAAMAVFTGIKLSDHLAGEAEVCPSVSLQMIEAAVAESAPVAKPKVVPLEAEKPRPEPEPKETPKSLVTEARPARPEPKPETAIAEPVEPKPAPARQEVEFFGRRSLAQRICFVVDCSGSMYGQMYRVKEKLKKTIGSLDPQQAFCAVFFMEGRQILMTGAGRLEPATVGAKSQAIGLIETIRPGGSTDAAHALECAMRLRGPDRHCPDVIYFLTDGFDLDDEGSSLFVEKINRLRNSLAPSAVLHTIGFWPQTRDRDMLKTLAQHTGGGYTEVQ